LIIFEIN